MTEIIIELKDGEIVQVQATDRVRIITLDQDYDDIYPNEHEVKVIRTHHFDEEYINQYIHEIYQERSYGI